MFTNESLWAAHNTIMGAIERRINTFDSVIVGSFGRHSCDPARTYGDLDILIALDRAEDEKPLRYFLGSIFGRHKNGVPKTSGQIGIVPVDIMIVNKNQSGAAEIFYTATPALQVSLRAIAAARGLSFGPKGIRPRSPEKSDFFTTPDRQNAWGFLGVREISNEEMVRTETYELGHIGETITEHTEE